MAKIRLSGIIKESIVDGPGIRFVVFAQGCNLHCKGCHNPETHDPRAGYEEDIENILKKVKQNPLLRGVTFSGGDPFLQARSFSMLAESVHKIGLDIVTYTGHTYEQILKISKKNPDCQQLLNQTDILIDGPFLLEKKDLSLDFRGSSNQRIINIKTSE